jgi:hypothetical protein
MRSSPQEKLRAGLGSISFAFLFQQSKRVEVWMGERVKRGQPTNVPPLAGKTPDDRNGEEGAEGIAY